MKELAYIGGEFCPIDQATVSIDDRGFQFGDGVYEVVAVYGGRPFLLDAHLKRLQNSLKATEIKYDLSAHPLKPIIEEGLRLAEVDDQAMVYLQITRGVQARSHVYDDDLTPTVLMTIRPLPQVPHALRESGLSLMTCEDLRWAHCYIKAITLLPNILAKNTAIRRGFHDAVFVRNGMVSECTSANIFLVRDGAVVTPPRSEGVLHGITQGFLMDCAASTGVPIREDRFTLENLVAADEVFMSSTTLDVIGVTRIDSHTVADGVPGPVTRRLRETYLDKAMAGAADAAARAGGS